MTSVPATSASSEYLGRLWVFRDVTNERAADRSKSEFVSMVSHELRTLLTSLIGFIELVLDGAGGEVNPVMERMLNKARTNGIRLSRLVAAWTFPGSNRGTWHFKRARFRCRVW
jgi:signal transduction histidine kinase